MALAAKMAKKMLAKPAEKSARVIALTGDLGSGKTAFVRGFLRAAGVRGPITSPTFTLIRRYSLKKGISTFHMDAYRIKNRKELSFLGFAEILKDPNNILLIEWSERMGSVLPKRIHTIHFAHGKKENERMIEM